MNLKIKDRISLLSIDQSLALKGFLTLLIILGHNSFAMENPLTEEKKFIFKWLYTFHVICFFILPFLYGYSRLTKRKLIDNFIKLYVPYIWILVVCLFLYYYSSSLHFSDISLGECLYAFLYGNMPLLKQVFGFNFPWFLPTMFSLLVLKGIYEYLGRGGRVLIYILSFLYWVLIFLGIVSVSEVGNYIPFAISQAFYYFPIALVAQKIVDTLGKMNKESQMRIYSILMLIFLTVTFFITQYILEVVTIIKFVMPIGAIITLYSFKDIFAKSHLLKLIGGYSLPIYLFHVIIFNVLKKLISATDIGVHFLTIISFILTVILSLLLSIALKRITPSCYNLMFPVGLRSYINK